MKPWPLLVALLVSSFTALAEEGVWGKGTVQSIDEATGQATLTHEAIPALQWPAMTMPIPVADKATLATMKPGQTLAFELVQDPKAGYVIRQVKPAP